MIITDHGPHQEKKEGEVFAGFLTVNQCQTGRFWDYQRLGKPVDKKYETGNRPWFLLESEIWEKGWLINRKKL